MTGKNNWYIVDGYRPYAQAGKATDYEGHECIMILNCNEQPAHVVIDVYFADQPPVKGITLTVPPERISAFRSNDASVFGDLVLPENYQYSLKITSDVGVVVQYGRMDINQPNLAYIATLGFAE